MATQQPPAPAPSIELGDIYYTVFRHKKKILLCSFAGLAAAFALYKLRPPPYQSQAKLMIKYVLAESRPQGPGDTGTDIQWADRAGATIINSEVQIMTSLDLAQAVVKKVGPARILAGSGGGDDPAAAAIAVKANILVEPIANTKTIRIVYTNKDPLIVQEVLAEFITSYQEKHIEVHNSAAMSGDQMSREIDQARTDLANTEAELRRILNEVQISSLEDYRKNSAEQQSRLSNDIAQFEAELRGNTRQLEALNAALPGQLPDASAQAPAYSQDQLAAYQSVSEEVAALQQRVTKLLADFLPENANVVEAQAQLKTAADKKKQMETATPSLLQAQLRIVGSSPVPATRTFDPVVEAARNVGMATTLDTKRAQLESRREWDRKVGEKEAEIEKLSRAKADQTKRMTYYSEQLQKVRANAMGADPGISEFEHPTYPARDWSKQKKLLGGLAAGGIAVGFVWAFLIELFLDRSVRKAKDIEKLLRLPLFLSIPRLKAGKGGVMSLPGTTRQALLAAGTPPADAATMVASQSSRGDQPALNPFFETLRDRLVSFFDSINNRHKPKLVAVTGIGTDGGVTTVAAGLARSISETGEGNVLLVDMTQGQGSTEHFHKGKSINLEQLFDTRQSARVQENLFVVGESSSSERLAKGMPQRFSQLIPKLKASDFDYIIFDMPPVSQISITPRLASFMDMVLLVVESEKTDREIAQRAAALLTQSKANVGVVLNKTKTYVPAALYQDGDFLVGT